MVWGEGMTSRIQQKFSELKAQRECALIPFITAGDPTLAKTADYVKALAEGGADIIELGMPFSDPMADGPVIQEADERALERGTSLQDILDLVARIRRSSDIPIVLMGYYNPIFRYGVARFAREARAAGVDGCLIADLPVEESDEVLAPFKRAGLELIYLLAPTSNRERIKKVAAKAQGYLYYVSMTGITGEKLDGLKAVKQRVAAIQKLAKQPLAVGFGIKTPAIARAVSRFADAVVIGSAFVKEIGNGASTRKIRAMTRGFKDAMR